MADGFSRPIALIDWLSFSFFDGNREYFFLYGQLTKVMSNIEGIFSQTIFCFLRDWKIQ